MMQRKMLSLMTLMLAGALVLTGCNDTEKTDNEQLSEAAQYCIDNGGSFEIRHSETAVWGECTLADGTVCEEWEYFEGTCPGGDKSQSLTLGELIDLIENNFPRAYDYTITNISTNESEKGTHVYTLDELGFITPEYSNIVDREVTSSGIEDGMIYTLVKATLDDGKEIEVLYIVDPATRNFVAANIEDGDVITNYQFKYYVESLTYEDIEGLAESHFPTSSTYTIYDFTTEETFTGENNYHEDTPHNLVNITPEFPATTEQKLLSSGIQDGMIYTNFDVIFDNGTTGNILYINNPESLHFVAANVESQGSSINYQFAY